MDRLKASQQPIAETAASGDNVAQAPFNELLALYQQGDFSRVLAQGEALALQFPTVPVIPNLLGAVNVGLGNLEQAVANYSNALQIKPDFVEARSNLAAVLNDLGRYAEAIPILTGAIRINPDFAEAYNNLGNALNYLGRHQEAVSSYDNALRLAPDSVTAHNNRGAALHDLGRSEEAVSNFARALRLNPDFAEAHNNLGSTLNDLGKPEEAAASLTRALHLRPIYAEAHNNLGNALSDLGKPEQAATSYGKALQIKPDFAAAHRNLSAVKKYHEDDAQLRAMQELLEQRALPERDRMYLYFALGKAHGDIGQYDQAFSCLAEGNRLLRKERNFDLSSAQLLFDRLKATFREDVPIMQAEGKAGDEMSPQPVFILGMPRSGTTLAEQILASHSQVYGAGELRLLAKSIRTAEWKSAMLTSDQLQSIRNSYLSGLRNISGSEPYITDKMPLNFQWVGFIVATMPEAKIVHVKRDARAVCWSNFKHYFSRKGIGFANDLQDVAEYYKLYDDLMAFWHRQFPGRIYDLNYEALTQHQEDEIRKLLKYVGLDWEDQCLEFYKTERAIQTASANQVRQEMFQGSSDEWRKYAKHLEPMLEILSDL